MFIQRSLSYLAITNAVMVTFLTISELNENYGFNIDMKLAVILVIPFLLVFFTFLGWFDDKIGLFRSEAGHSAQRNPIMVETLERTKKIEGMLNKNAKD